MNNPTDEERARLSGPAMRIFTNIAKRWDLSERRQLQILGCNQREFQIWVRAARWRKPLVLETDIVMRISAILGIFADLRRLLKTAAEERQWVLRPVVAPPFAGQAPINLLTLSYEHQIEVRLYLAGAIYDVANVAPNEADIDCQPHAPLSIIWH